MQGAKHAAAARESPQHRAVGLSAGSHPANSTVQAWETGAGQGQPLRQWSDADFAPVSGQ